MVEQNLSNGCVGCVCCLGTFQSVDDDGGCATFRACENWKQTLNGGRDRADGRLERPLPAIAELAWSKDEGSRLVLGIEDDHPADVLACTNRFR